MKSNSFLWASLVLSAAFTVNPVAAQPDTIESSQASHSGIVYPERVTGKRHGQPPEGPGKLPVSAETQEEKEFEKQFGFNPPEESPQIHREEIGGNSLSYTQPGDVKMPGRSCPGELFSE